MGCCGSSGPRNVRSQSVSQPQRVEPAKPQTIRRVSRSTHQSAPAAPIRQYAAPRHTCPKCAHPAIVVHIAKRERIQCSNINCKMVIK